MTLRSDNNDKFAQPDGVWIGARGTPTNVTADGPALKGAKKTLKLTLKATFTPARTGAKPQAASTSVTLKRKKKP